MTTLEFRRGVTGGYQLSMALWTAATITSLTTSSSICDCSSESRQPHHISSLWVNHGGGEGLTNQRAALHEKTINRTSVTRASLKWEIFTGHDVTATPAIADGVVYFLARLGWQFVLLSRSTPTVAGNLLVLGLYGPGAVIAVSRSHGELIWAKQLVTHPYAVITMSGTAYAGAYYRGTSALEEGILGIVCCTFQGAWFKLDLKTGQVVWKVPMIPDNQGQPGRYAGVAVWGSSPSIDISRRLIFIATGNAFSTPPEVDECESKYRNQTSPPVRDVCLPADDHEESILAIVLDDGTVSWSKHLGGYDTFNYVCSVVPPPGNCQAVNGPDYDFGECPMLVRSRPNGGSSVWRDIVMAGQKSGFIWALDRATGELVWVTSAGPGGFVGGSLWGMTTDGLRVFTNIINNEGLNFTLLPSSTVVNTGVGWL